MFTDSVRPFPLSVATPDRLLKQKRLTLARFLVIVYLLDRAKGAELAEGCLFLKVGCLFLKVGGL